MDTKGLQKEFINWCKSNKKQPKSKEETQQLFVAFMKEKHPEEYKAAMENQLKQAQKALHGAKLQYIRSLKNQCPEGEELYYYKKGGSVGCGCKKKMEEGGQTPKNKNNAIDKFKNRKQDLATKDSIAVNNYGAEDIEATRPGTYKKNKEGKVQWTPDRTKAPYNKTSKKEKGGKAEKDCVGSKMKLKKKGGEVCPKCGKVHAAGMGCAVAKFKYLYGGAFFGGQYEMYRDPQTGEIIQPYVQKTPTAPDATERFRGGLRNILKNNGQVIREVIRKRGIGNPARIQQIINGQDTTYIENPGSFMPFVKTKNRIISNNSNDRRELGIMSKRFKKAWDVTSPKSGLEIFDLKTTPTN